MIKKIKINLYFHWYFLPYLPAFLIYVKILKTRILQIPQWLENVPNFFYVTWYIIIRQNTCNLKIVQLRLFQKEDRSTVTRNTELKKSCISLVFLEMALER